MTSKNEKSDIKYDKILSCARRGLRLSQASKELVLSTRTIQRICQKHGRSYKDLMIKVPQGSKKVTQKTTSRKVTGDKKYDIILKMTEGGASLKEVAEKLKISTRTIQRICQKHGHNYKDLLPKAPPPRKLPVLKVTSDKKILPYLGGFAPEPGSEVTDDTKNMTGDKKSDISDTKKMTREDILKKIDEKKHTHKVTFDDIVDLALKNLTIKEASKILEINPRTIQRICDLNNCKYKELQPREMLVVAGDEKGGLKKEPKVIYKKTPDYGPGAYQDVTEQTLKDYVLFLANTSPPDVRIANMMFALLREKKELVQDKNSNFDITLEEAKKLMEED
ncbi:MAG: helix-turn-helix domain-containing protein [Candidatus Helarchaeota archaeon]